METVEYDIYIVYPSATVTILEGGMSDPHYAEDGLPHAQYGFLTAPDERTYIVEGLEPVEITSDLVGVYHLEASLYVLRFEQYSSNEKEK